MKTFLQRFGSFVLGILCGFDRMRFRGSKRQLCYPNGIMGFLQSRNIAPGQFKEFALNATEALFQAIEPPAKEQGIYRYLNSIHASPEGAALEIAAQNKQTQGLIAVLGRVEPCQTIQWQRGKNGWLMPHLHSGAKCLHYYCYYRDPEFGLRYTRLQTWFPFTMHIGMNGRDWLACQMTHAGIRFTQKDNCFTWVDDFAAAQQLLDAQLTTHWSNLLQGWAEQSNPLEPVLLEKPMPYYWTMQEGEFATDIVFRSAEALRHLYPVWVHHAYATLHSGDLLRFMNYRTRKGGLPYTDADLKGNLRDFTEGTCVRHRINGNLLKMYDKMGSVLRLETLLRDVSHFRVLRTSENGTGEQRIMRLRKGVADIHRRADVSRTINDRYVQSLATVADPKPLRELIKPCVRPAVWKGRTVRALNAFADDDIALLEAVHRGVFLMQGFRNKDIRALLFPQNSGVAEEQKRQSAQVTRRLTLLRAHGLITRIPKTHRYQVSEKGRTILGALAAARAASTEQLLQAA